MQKIVPIGSIGIFLNCFAAVSCVAVIALWYPGSHLDYTISRGVDNTDNRVKRDSGDGARKDGLDGWGFNGWGPNVWGFADSTESNSESGWSCQFVILAAIFAGLGIIPVIKAKIGPEADGLTTTLVNSA